METIKLYLSLAFIYAIEGLFYASLIKFFLYLIDKIREDPKEKELLKEYKAHRSEFEQWLKYKDKTMRGDY